MSTILSSKTNQIRQVFTQQQEFINTKWSDLCILDRWICVMNKSWILIQDTKNLMGISGVKTLSVHSVRLNDGVYCSQDDN